MGNRKKQKAESELTSLVKKKVKRKMNFFFLSGGSFNLLSILVMSSHQEKIISCNLRLGPFVPTVINGSSFAHLFGSSLACLFFFSHEESISD